MFLSNLGNTMNLIKHLFNRFPMGLGIMLGVLLAPFVACEAKAEVHLLEPTKASIEQYKILSLRGQYWDYVPEAKGEEWSSGGAFNLDLNMVRWDWFRFYMENHIHMDSTSSQIRAGGWLFSAGFNFFEKVDIHWRHHSQHLLDAKPDWAKERSFPVEDRIVLELCLLKK
jgi:hypothetical protein